MVTVAGCAGISGRGVGWSEIGKEIVGGSTEY